MLHQTARRSDDNVRCFLELCDLFLHVTASEINPHAFTYGYERLRFPKPVFIGDTIHTVLKVTAKEPDPKRAGFGKIVETIRVLNQRGETVLACDHILLAAMKSAG